MAIEWKMKFGGDRFFKPEKYIKEIDWDDFSQVVDFFQGRIIEWYIQPAEYLQPHGGFGFPIMALNCLLIDTLSQYDAGCAGTRKIFIEFVRSHLPLYAQSIKLPIKYTDDKNKPQEIRDCAELLYHGFRCGILHEAGFPPCCMMNEHTDPVVIKPTGEAYYLDGSDCTAVDIDPYQLRDAIKDYLGGYIAKLKDSGNLELRKHFADTFKAKFGTELKP